MDCKLIIGFSESSTLTVCLLYDAVNIAKLHTFTGKKSAIHPGMELRLSYTIYHTELLLIFQDHRGKCH